MTLTLYRYRLARTANGALYAYGYDKRTADVCIVKLSQFNSDTMTGADKDGYAVRFEGAPALDMNASALWVYHCNENALGRWHDATP